MKNRDYKTFYTGAFYHIYNRGNNKQNIFLDDEDKTFFLHRLKENILGERINSESTQRNTKKLLASGLFQIICYCLMSNHYHVLIKQETNLPINKLIHKVTTSYSMYFNKKYERVGQVFQDQFKAIHIDRDEYLVWLSAYIHANPLSAHLVEDLNNYPWSSYLEYMGLRNGNLCSPKVIIDQFASPELYKHFIYNNFSLVAENKSLLPYLLDP